MKNLFILTAAILLAPLFSIAQIDPELDYIKTAYSKDKKSIVEQYMALDVQEAGKFWSVYGSYETQREKLAVERMRSIQEYVNSAEALTPDQADKIAKAVLTNTINLARLNLESYSKIKTAIGPVKAAKFMQLETYLQTAWRGFVQENIPMISELDKTQKN